MGGKTATATTTSSATAGVTAFGASYCWGASNYGQLGNGGTAKSSVPVGVAIAGDDNQAGTNFTFVIGPWEISGAPALVGAARR